MKRSREQVKVELMGKLESALDRVLDWQEEHVSFTLTELEDFVLGLREELGADIAEAVVGQLESKQVADVLSCRSCGGKMVYKGQEGKYIETRLGGLEIERGRYWCLHCKQGIFPPG
jgi:DNA-directed RNA polymerase subunit RPC12/RpoP